MVSYGPVREVRTEWRHPFGSELDRTAAPRCGTHQWVRRPEPELAAAHNVYAPRSQSPAERHGRRFGESFAQSHAQALHAVPDAPAGIYAQDRALREDSGQAQG